MIEELDRNLWKRWRTISLPFVGPVRLLMRPWWQHLVIWAVVVVMAMLILLIGSSAKAQGLQDFGFGAVVMDSPQQITPSQQHFFADLSATWGQSLTTGVNQTTAQIFSAIAPQVTGLLVLWVILLGTTMGLGKISEGEFWWHMLRVGMVLAFLQAGHYNDWIGTFPDKAIAFISQAVGNTSNIIAGHPFDRLADQLNDQISLLLSTASGLEWLSVALVGSAIWIGSVLLILMQWAFFEVARSMMALIIAIGPVFILLFLFRATTNIGVQAAAQAGGWALTMLILAVVTSLVLRLNAQFMPRVTGTPYEMIVGLVHATLALAFGLFVTFFAPYIARAITGAAVARFSPLAITTSRAVASGAQRIGGRR